jgi:hypothetical protein
METQYSVVINSISGDLVALVLRSWIVNEDGTQTEIASEVKTNITMAEAFQDAQAFVQGGANG